MAFIPKPVPSALTALALLLLAEMAASFPLVAAENAPVKYRSVDRIKGIGAFMRCSTDHHNLLLMPAPVYSFPHTMSSLEGVLVRRGRVIPVCDLRAG